MVRGIPLFAVTSVLLWQGVIGFIAPSCAGRPASLLPAALDFLTADGPLWGLRIGSAVTSYVGFLAYLDRPRGGVEGSSSESAATRIGSSTVPGAGLGLFAARNLARGTLLGTYPGVLIPLTEANLGKVRKYPHCEAYIWRFSDSRFVLDPTNKVGGLDDVCVGGNPSMPGSVWLFETFISKLSDGVPTTLCRINEPPRGKDVNVITDEDLSERTVEFRLERDVVEGEEFFIDYGLTYDRSSYGGGGSGD